MVEVSKKLLIVGADERQSDSLSAILEEEGFCAVQCNSAEEAEQRIQQETFAIAVLREGEDGLIQRLRNQSPRTRVVIHASHSTPDLVRRTVKLGAFAYVRHPVDNAQELVMHLRRAADEWQAETEQTPQRPIWDQARASKRAEKHVPRRRNASLQWGDSDQRFRALCEHAPIGMFLSDNQGTCVYANREYLHLAGFDLASSANRGWIEAVHSDDRQRVTGQWQLAASEGRAFDTEYRIPREGGADVWMRCHMVPRWDGQARVCGYIGTLTDVTEHKISEFARQARVRQQSIAADLGWLALRGIGFHEFAQTVCERVAEGLDTELCKVLELLPDGELLFLRAGVGWNEGLVGHATLGTHRSSQAGYTLDSDQPVVVEDLRSETRFGGPPLLTDHGVVSGVSVVIGGVEPYGVLGAHTRTKRVFTAEDISFLSVVANLLAEFVERRAAGEQLRQHQRTLTHVSRLSTMGEMLAGITHEINQPLHAISNFATASIVSLHNVLEQADGAGDAVRQVLEWNTEVRSASRRACEMLQRMHNFARKGGHPHEAVNLNDLLRESIELAVFEARMAQVTLETDLDKSLPTLFCDRIQIEQVVVNLLLNAFEAFAETENWVRRVTVRSQVVDHHLTIQVVDNGPGIPPGGREIFDAFFTTKRDGMGMGLAISKTIVEDHGGRLTASNNERFGATLQIAFPLDKEGAHSAVDDFVRDHVDQ